MANLKKLSDQELLTLATGELIESIINFRAGLTKDFEFNDKYRQEFERRNLKFGISESFIHRVFQGEFDKADAIEIGITKAKESN